MLEGCVFLTHLLLSVWLNMSDVIKWSEDSARYVLWLKKEKWNDQILLHTDFSVCSLTMCRNVLDIDLKFTYSLCFYFFHICLDIVIECQRQGREMAPWAKALATKPRHRSIRREQALKHTVSHLPSPINIHANNIIDKSIHLWIWGDFSLFGLGRISGTTSIICCGGTEKKKGHLDRPVPSNSAGASEIF